MQNNNPYTEVGAIVLAALLILTAGLLMYASKIDFTAATFLVTLGVGVYGGNLALKAPSPSQQAQIAAQHQDLQALAGQVVSVLPALFQAPQQQPPAQSVSAPQVQQQPFPNTPPVTQLSGRFPVPN